LAAVGHVARRSVGGDVDRASRTGKRAGDRHRRVRGAARAGDGDALCEGGAGEGEKGRREREATGAEDAIAPHPLTRVTAIEAELQEPEENLHGEGGRGALTCRCACAARRWRASRWSGFGKASWRECS